MGKGMFNYFLKRGGGVLLFLYSIPRGWGWRGVRERTYAEHPCGRTALWPSDTAIKSAQVSYIIPVWAVLTVTSGE